MKKMKSRISENSDTLNSDTLNSDTLNSDTLNSDTLKISVFCSIIIEY